jgi:hypothetical protein
MVLVVIGSIKVYLRASDIFWDSSANAEAIG